MQTHLDIYEIITASIIDAIETGCGPYEMPWNTFGFLPSNASNKRNYRGINVLALWASAQQHRFTTQLWATYQQWRELGAQVRKGERSTAVVFWKFHEEGSDGETDAFEDSSPDGPRSRCFARTYHVFNADQVDGFEARQQPTLPEAERLEVAEQFFRGTEARIVECGMRAYYDSNADVIHMPPFTLFKKADYFYSTLAHEVIHFSGHPDRCNRQLGNRFGSELYAAEELIAELGSAFLSAELQLATEPRLDNAPYVENWLKILRNDKRAIFAAASKAQQAVAWLVSRQNATAAAIA